MSDICRELHIFVNGLPRHSFPFDSKSLPQNGIYILFESGETAHGGDRIVRVGTHTGRNQLRPRLAQHFIKENKDRSIFRKNIGRSLLNRDHDPFLELWDLDLTTYAAKQSYSGIIDSEMQKRVERQVTEYIQRHFQFAVIEVREKEERLQLESKMISTVSWCEDCRPSSGWLGLYSPKEKICSGGLWIVNELYKLSLTEADLGHLHTLIQ
jgi:hypothetical protein